ncbi:hypothetical protein [Providencia vermicola]|uniref:hypothetical protein n=1 Tax=Providencia vermicola TaxID=333965 RepID=UPI003D2DD493
MKSDTFIIYCMITMSSIVFLLTVIAYISRGLFKPKNSYKCNVIISVFCFVSSILLVALYSFSNYKLSYIPPVSDRYTIENKKISSVFIRTSYNNNVLIREEMLNDKRTLPGNLSYDSTNFLDGKNNYYASDYNVIFNNVNPIDNTPAKLFNLMLSILLGFSFAYIISNLVSSFSCFKTRVNKTNRNILVFFCFIIIVILFLFPVFLSDNLMGFIVDYFPESIAVIASGLIALCMAKIFDLIESKEEYYVPVNRRIDCFFKKTNKFIKKLKIENENRLNLMTLSYLLITINNEIRHLKSLDDNSRMINMLNGKGILKKGEVKNKNLGLKIKTEYLNNNKKKKIDICEKIKNNIAVVKKMRDELKQMKVDKENKIHLLINDLDWIVGNFEFSLKELK